MANEIDDVLFKGMPKSVQALNKLARKENRQKRRAAWIAQHPERMPVKR
jgi:hypothetical protein